jgi:hypothetical protein
MPLASAGAILAIALVLFAAPLVLGAYVVLQRASASVATLYFGFLSVLLLVALVAATFGLLAASR